MPVVMSTLGCHAESAGAEGGEPRGHEQQESDDDYVEPSEDPGRSQPTAEHVDAVLTNARERTLVVHGTSCL
jgi:hypothetical protein